MQAEGEGCCHGPCGIDWEEDSVFLSVHKRSDPLGHALGERRRRRFVSGWRESSAAHRAAQRHRGSVATHLPSLLLCLSGGPSPLMAHGRPCRIQRLSASPALADGLLGCFLSGAAARPVPSRFPGWLWCPPGPVVQADLAGVCSASH